MSGHTVSLHPEASGWLRVPPQGRVWRTSACSNRRRDRRRDRPSTTSTAGRPTTITTRSTTTIGLRPGRAFCDSSPEAAVCRRTVTCLAVACILGYLAAAYGQGIEVFAGRGNVWEPGAAGLTRYVVTPHIAWGVPYARGKVRVLVIGAERETVELMQRLDLDCTTVLVPLGRRGLGEPRSRRGAGIKAKGFKPDEKAAELEQKLKDDYDAMILLLPWRHLTVPLQLALLRKIQTGVGLLTTDVLSRYPREHYLRRAYSKRIAVDHDFITTGVPFEGLPVILGRHKTAAAARKNVAITARLGDGRLAWLDYKGFLAPSREPVPDTYLTNEYHYSLAIKALLWAAKREPMVPFDEPTIEVGPPADPAKPAQAEVRTVLVSRMPDPLEATVTVVDRMALGPREHAVLSQQAHRITLPPGASEHAWSVPALRDGDHYVDVVIRDGDKRVINWATVYATVRLPCRVDLALAEEHGPADEPVAGRVEVSRPLPEGVQLGVELVDNYGRVLDAETLAPGAGETDAAFSLNARRSLTRLVTARATLTAGDAVLQQTREEVLLTQFRDRLDHEDFHAIVWHGNFAPFGYDFLYQEHLKQIKAAGFDIVYQPLLFTFPGSGEVRLRYPEERLRVVARQNLAQLPYFIRFFYDLWYTKDADVKSLERKPCLTDPAYRENVADVLALQAGLWRSYSPPAYPLGDETNLAGFHSDICHSPTCLDYFRNYLQGQYEGLDALNRQWGTSFGDWREVKPDTFKQAQKRGNPSSWVDHWLCMESVWADFMGFCGRTIRETDPEAPIGLEGDMHSRYYYTGYDWWKLMEVFDFMVPYGIREPVLSFARKGTLRGRITGTYGGYHQASNRSVPWLTLFRHGNALFFWTGNAALNHDYTPTLCLKWSGEEIREIRRGIGKMLVTADRPHDGIAVHYSRPSIIAELFLPKVTSVVLGSQAGFERWLDEVHLQYRYLSHQQIEAGELARQGYRALVLPFSQALSDAEAEQVERFVTEGGVLVADLRPGIVDGHGKTRAKGALDHVFGISRDLSLKPQEGKPVEVGSVASVTDFAGALPFTTADGQVACATGQACAHAGETPAVIVHPYGKGRAILLNFPAGQFLDARKDGAQHGALVLLRSMLAKASVGGRLRVRDGKGRDILAASACWFERGPIRYVGLIKDPELPADSPEEAHIPLPKAYHVYDVRAKKYLGKTAEIVTVLAHHRPLLFALLPYRVDGVRLTARTRKGADGPVVTFSGRVQSAGEAGDQVVRIEFFDPEGKPLAHYGRNILARRGKFAGELPLGLNESEGAYRVTARDVISGARAEAPCREEK